MKTKLKKSVKVKLSVTCDIYFNKIPMDFLATKKKEAGKCNLSKTDLQINDWTCTILIKFINLIEKKKEKKTGFRTKF